MTDVAMELLPEHPILALESTETFPERGIHNGEVLGFLCLACKNMDEDISEIIHEEDCPLAGQTKPTAYHNRPEGPLEHINRDAVATDGGNEN